MQTPAKPIASKEHEPVQRNQSKMEKRKGSPGAGFIGGPVHPVVI
jgi:hypothetical protein